MAKSFAARTLILALGLLAHSALTLIPRAESQETNRLIFYNWDNYIHKPLLKQFEAEYRAQIDYRFFKGNDELETMLGDDRVKFDLAVPTIQTFGRREAAAEQFLKLDRSQLSNYSNIDPELLRQMALDDPNNDYFVPWFMNQIVIAFDRSKIEALLPNAPLNSYRMVFDPEILKKLQSCGVEFIDETNDVMAVALHYMKFSQNSINPDDYSQVSKMLTKVSPYIRKFDTQEYVDNLVNGKTCLALGYSSDIMVANRMRREAGIKGEIEMIVPIEGTLRVVDVIGIAAKSQNPKLAHKFINFILRADKSALNINNIGAYNGNREAINQKLVREELLKNPGIFPTAEGAKASFTMSESNPQLSKLRRNYWYRLKANRNSQGSSQGGYGAAL
ncbi:MAG: extracellular solute-binding protein [Candidatus Pacebacteria bacterium]|nr:extracellular solute-binding protein [Candidatus Paceibacterota bacterium]